MRVNVPSARARRKDAPPLSSTSNSGYGSVGPSAPPALPAAALADDLLQGADDIAKFMGLSRRQAYHLAAAGRIPVFKMGAIVCARRSTILRWIAEQEAKCGGGVD